jgi:hypothetical protein
MKIAKIISLLLATSLFGCSNGGASEDETLEDVGESVAAIKDTTPLPPNELLGMVKVFPPGKMCSGMLIARDTVLTAAHCFCDEDLVGSNNCSATADVEFRDNPAVAGTFLPKIAGTVTIHPGYNPSWTDKELENDLALVHLSSAAPAYVPAFTVASQAPNSFAVQIVGAGHTGSDCDGPSGDFNFDLLYFNSYVDDGKIIQFNDPPWCHGDSGGAVLGLYDGLLHGVISGSPPTLTHGFVGKAIAVHKYYNWIKSNTCSAGENSCDNGPICRCGLGEGDCSTSASCKPNTGMICLQDAGASFGLPATTDVCGYPPCVPYCTGTECGASDGCGSTCYGNCDYGYCAMDSYGFHCAEPDPPPGGCEGPNCYEP